MNPPLDPDQVRALFHAVVDLLPDERRQYLDAHCPDPKLRQRVERLVAADATVHQTAPSESGRTGTPAAPEAEEPPNLPGFESLEQIATGGMGVVWRVRDPQFPRTLAVKVMKAALCDNPSARRRFDAEARITGQLTHPAIVPVHAMGSLPDGRPYYLMKLVEGKTFSALLRDRPGPASLRTELLQVFAQVCQAAAFAHSRGVIHRDLKPSNIMVGEHGEVQVMDWGLAKVLAGADPPPPDAAPAKGTPDEVREMKDTHPGSVLGTWAYMPPEQARGQVAEPDRRSDVFALGAILCQLLTGQPPYVGSESGSVQLQAKEARLDGALARLRGCGADGELIRLAERCLSANKIDRPADASEVASALVAYQAGVQERLRQAEVERGQAQVKAAEERKRRRLALALALALVLLLGGVGAAAFWYQQDREARRTQAEGGVRLNLKEAVLLGERAWTLIDNPSAWQTTLQAASAAGKRAQNILEQEPELVGGKLAQEVAQVQVLLLADERDRLLLAAFDEARAERSLSDASGRRLRVAESYARLKGALKEYGLPVGESTPEHAATVLRGRPPVVQSYLAAILQESWWLAPTAGEEEQQGWLAAVLAAADGDGWRQQVRQALARKAWPALGRLLDQPEAARQHPAFLVALSAALRAADPASEVGLLRRAQRQHPYDFWVNFALATALYESVFPNGEARPARAEGLSVVQEVVRYFTAAVALRPGSASAHNTLGNALAKQGDVKEATACYRKALDLNPRYAPAHVNLGVTLAKMKDPKGAIACFQKALRFDPKDISAHLNLGNVLCNQKDWKRAAACYQKVLDLDPKLAAAHYNLGTVFQAQGDPKRAIDCYRKALDVDPRCVPAHLNLGVALRDQRDLPGAIASFRKALDLNPKLVEAHLNLGNAFQDQGDLKRAIDCYTRAVDLAPQFAEAHLNLGNVLYGQKDWKGAFACYKRALALDPKFAEAHCNLGHALREQGHFAQALEALQQGHELGSQQTGWRYPSAKWVEQCQHLLDLDARLNAILADDGQPKDTAEQLALADLCQRYKKRYAAAARFYAAAFAAKPKLTPAQQVFFRYNAACTAVLAAAGQGQDASKLEGKEKRRLRQQARAWLQENRKQYTGQFDDLDAKQRADLQKTLQHWQQDADLVSVRDADALTKLPEAERTAWQQLWAEVETLCKKSGATP
jgi:tetratricopeptide (TPR) repeat protein